jgi:hypothetical protein
MLYVINCEFISSILRKDDTFWYVNAHNVYFSDQLI